MARMPKTKTVLENPERHAVGDKVVWNGIVLTVIEITSDNHVRAWSPHMQLYVSEHELLTKAQPWQVT